MEDTKVHLMSSRQRLRLQSLLALGIPSLSSVEAKSAIKASGTLLQGVHAAFEPFMRERRGQPVTIQHDSNQHEFALEVPYHGAKTIRMLLNSGSYDWQNTDISDKNFPQYKTGNRKILMQLVSFEKVIGTQDVLRRLKKSNLVPANPAELLTLGTIHPRIQLQYPIVALGQRWSLPNGDELVVCLAWHSMLRRVHLLCQFRRDWPAHCRFAVIVK